MSRLQELIMRLAEKKGVSLEDQEDDCSVGSTDDSCPEEGKARSSGDSFQARSSGVQQQHAHGSSSVYGSKKYWDDRYEEGVIGHSADKGVLSNEWYLTYSELKDALNRHVDRSSSILLLGCGLSTLGSDMERDGYSNITCVDYSPICIERMQELAKNNSSHVQYRVMDVTQLVWGDGSWDCVLDKATLDSLMNDDDCSEVVPSMLSEAARVLRPGGRYVCISHSDRRGELGVMRGSVSSIRDGDSSDGGSCGGDEGAPLSLPWELKAEETLAKNKARFWMGVLEKHLDDEDQRNEEQRNERKEEEGEGDGGR